MPGLDCVSWTMPSAPQPLRLVADRYAEPGRAFAVTICVRGRRPVFLDAVFARHCVDFLRALATMTGTRLYAYCLMPDHVHLLLSPSHATSIPGFVGRWKSLCAREWLRRSGEASFWTESFHDRVLAEDEDLLRIGNYILMNPVRVGLVDRPEAYRFAGSGEWDLGRQD